ncbi:MAG: hypothetical protein QM767_18140 [Anaeromyxobacter sp.]
MDNEQDSKLRQAALEALTVGLLRIRAMASAGDSTACGIEAYHLHNLPHLAERPNYDELEYYLTIERVGFLKHRPRDVAQFDNAWKTMQALLDGGRWS